MENPIYLSWAGSLREAIEIREILQHLHHDDSISAKILLPLIQEINITEEKEENYLDPIFTLDLISRTQNDYKEKTALLENREFTKLVTNIEFNVYEKNQNLRVFKTVNIPSIVMVKKIMEIDPQFIKKNIINLTLNVVEALEFLYNLDVTHNDVRVENICFDFNDKMFKLLFSEKSSSLRASNYKKNAKLDKIGLLVAIFEVSNIVSCKNFNPVNRKEDFERLEEMTSKTFVSMIESFLGAKEDFSLFEINELYHVLFDNDVRYKDGTKSDPNLYQKLNSMLPELRKTVEAKQKPSQEIISAYWKVLTNSSDRKSSPYYKNNNAEDDQKNYEEHNHASICIANYMLRFLKHLNSQVDVEKLVCNTIQAKLKYGDRLIPHPKYQLNQYVPTQSEIEKDELIRSKLKANVVTAESNGSDSSKSTIFEILTAAMNNSGVNLLLTDQDSTEEFNNMHMAFTGGLDEKFVRLTIHDLNEKDYEKMANDKEYAQQIYKQMKKALFDSNMFSIQKESDIKIVAVECNSPVTGVFDIPNFILNDPSEFKQDQNVSIVRHPVFTEVKMSENTFDSRGNMEWNNTWSQYDMRGGMKYYFPKNTRGFGISVLGKYEDDIWLESWGEEGWAVAYHGMKDNIDKIESAIKEGLHKGPRQVHATDINVQANNEQVGEGVYFAQKANISFSDYSIKISVGMKRYKLILQCRLHPKQIKIPKGQEEYYIVSDKKYIRPYRVLVQEVKRPSDFCQIF